MELDSLYAAVDEDDVQAVTTKLEAGVDVNVKKDWRGWGNQTLLHVASRSGKTKVAALLIKNGADIEAGDWYQNIPLHEAANKGHTGTCELLICSGADIMARTEVMAISMQTLG
ncbi:uncharacterized protein [Branchiostoma lanceolatum]|uniref:uncharacterized protein n=1 Tax=Branchiostoma lanceolatum TaxID=7740 RepID=UPI0034523B3A